jgi:uncharacterized tellurite resistance protein B-like protein
MNFSELLLSIQKVNKVSKSHMKNLIEIAAADGNFIDAEYALLKAIARENGISESRLTEIERNPGDIKFEVPKNEGEKFRQLFDLVKMMSIDNEVHPKEADLCALFAINFGYPRKHVSELIEAIRENIRNGQNAQETKKRVILLLSDTLGCTI